MKEEYIKLIFGLKLKQIRTDKNLSLFGLSKILGLSKSYLNEIEKGKKYPKTDKILLISEKLDIPYDYLVSLKLNKNLAPIGEILKSNILKEIPFELFGIKKSNLIDIIANAPSKVNAFISTIIEIAQHYNFSIESFYLASVRSLQEANNNYFSELEEQVNSFAKAYHIDLIKKIESKDLLEVLVEEYGYKINICDEFNKHKELADLRSIYIPKTKTLLLANHVDEAQTTFIYAKEIAYNYLKIKDRLYTFPWIKFENFDQVLNNFYASYFAGALILPKNEITRRLETFFNNATFNYNLFVQIITSFTASPESFYQRLTNILPKNFGLHDLFFLRFVYKKNGDKFHLNKELHLSQQHLPRANESNEKYCRRWVSLKVIQEIIKKKEKHIFDAQISHYPETNESYLVLSSATKDPFKSEQYRSISIGLLINNQLKRKVAFLDDEKIKTQVVGVTCERCGITDCKVRKAPPTVLDAELKDKNIETVVEELAQKYG